ncbi:hypothetical protein I5Q34_16210 [Streptomyces sp. AV19]|uniref:hypothetical protein n=1 Tax=Streptomyces sp. AV19 TaxID=2793068 RepID=UPI0018FF0A41|nr:hypothetical protein [Streptomyces sp. AV19]MBH1935795.1 hypothetical protein [Streptomyces sp. AV19]MDG4536097.1 hypothetical protein [Streptomyces sp. AV19]
MLRCFPEPDRAETIRTEPARETGPAHALHGLEPAVRMGCGGCDDVFVEPVPTKQPGPHGRPDPGEDET